MNYLDLCHIFYKYAATQSMPESLCECVCACARVLVFVC